MTTQGMIRSLENVIEKYKDKPVYTGEIDIPLMCRDIINKLKELSCPWHTGTPTEEGWYLIAWRDSTNSPIKYDTEPFKDGKWLHYTVDRLAWQKIEPYNEDNNGKILN